MEWLKASNSEWGGQALNIKWAPKLDKDMWKLIKSGLAVLERNSYIGAGSARRTKKRCGKTVTMLVATEKGKRLLTT